MNGTRLGLYDPLKSNIESLYGRPAFLVNVLSGGICGIVAAGVSIITQKTNRTWRL